MYMAVIVISPLPGKITPNLGVLYVYLKMRVFDDDFGDLNAIPVNMEPACGRVSP